MGFEGLLNLMKFVQEGGLLITEGSTSTIFPDYHLVDGVAIEEPQGLFARGVVLKSVFADRKSPIAYGYDSDNLAVYFSQGPVINAGGAWRLRRLAAAVPRRRADPGRRDEPHAECDRLHPDDARRSASGGRPGCGWRRAWRRAG